MTVYQYDMTINGLYLRDEAGSAVYSETLHRDGDTVRRAIVGDWPIEEAAMPRFAVDHMADVWGRMSRSLRFAPNAVRPYPETAED